MALSGNITLPFVVNLKDCKSYKRKNPVIGIYKITSPSGKIYIGLSENIEIRFYRYKKLDCERQRYLCRSFKKHGVENHIFEIIHICEKHELDNLELHYGTLFNVNDKTIGLNIKPCGGRRTGISEETKKILSKLHSGKGNPFWGKKHNKEVLDILSINGKNISDEERERRCKAKNFLNKRHTKKTKKTLRLIAKKRKVHPFLNKKHSESTKNTLREKALERYSNIENHPSYRKPKKKSTINKISKTLKNKDWKGNHPNKGRKKSENECKDMSERAKKRIGNKNPFWNKHHTKKTKSIISKAQSVKVNQYELSGKFIKTWSSIKKAADKLGIFGCTISRACIGKQKKAGGYVWKYV